MEGFPINLCPHDIVVYDISGTNVIATFPHAETTSGPLRLIESPPQNLGFVNETKVPVYNPSTYVSLSYEPYPFRSIIVSQLVAQFMKQSGMYSTVTVYTPDTGPSGVVRDAKGTIIGTKCLLRYTM